MAKQNTTVNFDSEEMLDATQLAAFLKIDRTSVCRYAKSNDLPKPIKIGRTARWRKSKIMNWLEQREAMSK
jgi:predicted DNA-binding transcriptional regulator AlpA